MEAGCRSADPNGCSGGASNGPRATATVMEPAICISNSGWESRRGDGTSRISPAAGRLSGTDSRRSACGGRGPLHAHIRFRPRQSNYSRYGHAGQSSSTTAHSTNRTPGQTNRRSISRLATSLAWFVSSPSVSRWSISTWKPARRQPTIRHWLSLSGHHHCRRTHSPKIRFI